jgi:LysM repeat protein
VSRADLAEANYLTVRSRVSAGQQLIIPRAPTLLLAARPDNPAPAVEARSDVVAASNVTVPDPEPTRLVHRVKRGDTLSSIARLYRTTVASLKQWNRISGSAIQVGQRLTIFTRRIATTE